MPNYYDACKRIYEAFVRMGCAGIGGAGETQEVWVFASASKEPGVVEYGNNPIIINKKTGTSKILNLLDKEDREVYYSASIIDVPKEFMSIQ